MPAVSWRWQSLRRGAENGLFGSLNNYAFDLFFLLCLIAERLLEKIGETIITFSE
jgi:hypothetical protein